jgi:tetrahydromethanopterin S-methyltransferase subunit B
VILYDEPDGLAKGNAVPARDTGARNGVFSSEGGLTWLLMTGFVLGAVIAAVAWIVIIVRALTRRRTAAPVG